MSNPTSPIPNDMLPFPVETASFNPQQGLRHKKSFVTNLFSKRSRKDTLSDDRSETDSIRTTSSNGSSMRSFMFSRKQRSDTMSSSTSVSSFISTYSNDSTQSNGSGPAKLDKYGLPKDGWVPQYF